MKIFSKSFLRSNGVINRFVFIYLLFLASSSWAQSGPGDSLRYKIEDRKPYEAPKRTHLDLQNPSNIETKYTYDPSTGKYLETLTVGGKSVGTPRVISRDEYALMQEKKARNDYYRKKSDANRFVRGTGLIPQIHLTPPIFDKVFGGGLIDIRPAGSAEVIFGGRFNKVENPAFPVRQQKNGQFDFDMKMQLNVTGQIGEKVKLNWNYDTEATFEFENQMKLNWEGEEDDILKKIELGNVGLPLNGSLIQGGQNLFGIKTQMQFGKLKVAAIATQQRGETRETEINGGAQITEYNIRATDYDHNRHYFLAQYFRDNYDNALSTLPLVRSSVLVNYIEVWVTNRSNIVGNSRDVTGFMDLGESNPYNPNVVRTATGNFPDNNANTLYNSVTNKSFCDFGNPNIQEGFDYECVSNARQLTINDFTINSRLGYISLNQALNNDEVLMVSFEYTVNGRRFQVGEFSRDNAVTGTRLQPLVLKLLKPTTIKTQLPIWDLMMKNIYSLNSFNIKSDDFSLNVVYADDKSGADLNYLPVEPNESKVFEKQLIDVLNLDKVNRQMEAKPDGIFDMVEGITFNASKGFIIFPVLEPFGKHLASKLNNQDNINYFGFQALYDSTKWLAEQDITKNKFFLVGRFKGSATDVIRLQCFNITRGSVRVTANGSPLREGSDFIVDYTMGTVRITNEGIMNSGAVIKASCESQALLNLQQKSLSGLRFDYKFSQKLLLGGTFMHMSERPLTPKVNIGEEPLLNSIWGLDAAYNTESRFLTKLVDKLPFIETKEISTVTFSGEFAHLIPHKPRTMGERGVSYIDDFEAAETPYDLKYHHNWFLASTPKGQPDLFPESALGDSFLNHRRANLAWYSIDVLFQSSGQAITPKHIAEDPEMRSDHFSRSVPMTEVFPTIELQQGQPNQLVTFDLAFYPKEKGQYNLGTEALNADGSLNNPKENWGGITRRVETNDFEAANIDYIEMWMMDPFVYQKHDGRAAGKGQLYINLGSISEDVLPDRRRSAENGLPTPSVTNTTEDTRFARVPSGQIINKTFDNDPSARPNQDKGLDGLNDDEERVFFKSYLDDVALKFGTGSDAYIQANNDPAGDNYTYFRDESYDAAQANILTRYKKIRGTEGNNTLDKLQDGTPKSLLTMPDDEDINLDHTVNSLEEYFQYKIEIDPAQLVIGRNYVTDSILVEASQVSKSVLPNKIVWYQLKIPVRDYEKAVGGIQDFKSIRFMRMFVKGFDDDVVLRFGNLQFVRSDWRRYLKTLKFPPNVGPPVNPGVKSDLVISTVNIVENSAREPVKYVTPPSISRVIDPTQPGSVQRNEQSLSLAVCNLEKTDARGAFKTLTLDIRNYKTLKMFLHAESNTAQDGDAVAFIRIGTDLENNFYQYEIPLAVTPAGSADPGVIWPTANELLLDLEKFYELKLEREKIYNSNTEYYSKKTPEGHTISVIGLPDMGNVRSILLGVKNAENSSVDQLCAEVWFNELRLVDFVNRSGWATTGRLVAKLADFATVSMSGNYQSIGFGAVNQKLNQRNLEEQVQYDISSNFELGKFFPQKSGISIPMFIGYSENILNPKYYPLNPDIELKTVLKNTEDREERKNIKMAAQDYTSRYSLNFTNIKKNKTSAAGKSYLWDISNFNYSFNYQKISRRSQIIELNDAKLYRSSLGYNFASKSKPWEPFKKIKSKKLNLIKDFNLTFVPQSLNARIDVDRRYSIMKNRNNDNFKAIVPLLYDKTFGMSRVYGMRWNIAKSITADYAATADSWIEEPFGALDTEQKRDSVIQNFLKMGTLRNFNQQANLSYALPFQKIKALNWITLTTRYSANFQWNTAPPAFSNLGNTIQNSTTTGINGNFNFISLYNRVPLLRKINQPGKAAAATNKRSFKLDTDADKEDTEKKKDEVSKGLKILGQALMMVKQAQFNYSNTGGMLLPGFTPLAKNIGNDFSLNAPGLPFVFGFQDDNFRYDMARRGFLTNDTNQNNPFSILNSSDFTASATVEPFKDFRISLTMNQRVSKNISSNFRFNPEINGFEDLMFNEFGTYTSSFGMWKTMFDKVEKGVWTSEAFDQFLANRNTAATRLQTEEFTNGQNAQRYGNLIGVRDSSGFPIGYSATNQDVLIHSFIAAYSGKDINSSSLNLLQRIPIPNWRVNYNGLTSIPFIGDRFTNFTLNHAYASTLNMGSYSLDIDYGKDSINNSGNLKTRNRFEGGISLLERLTPLIGVNATTKAGLNLKFEYKLDRNITLNAINFQMVEVRNTEFVIGTGYRAKDIRLPIKLDGRRILLKNDLNFRFDFSIRDGVTVVRQINTLQYTPTAGIKTISIRPTVDYMISEQLNFRMFYNRNVNKPVTSNSFPTALTEFGFAFRYTLQ